MQLTALLAGLADPVWEPALDVVARHLPALNRCVAESGVRLEGNLFYHHDTAPPLPDAPDPTRRHKRRNFALYVAGGTRLLEIGCNAGHSALLALAVDPALRYVGVDLAAHPYVRPCLEILRAAFPDRVTLLEGDSRDVLPQLRGETFDRFHIDGGHGVATADADLRNVMALSRTGQVVLMDDVHNAALDALVDWHCVRGVVSRVALSRLWAGQEQALLRVEPAGAGVR